MLSYENNHQFKNIVLQQATKAKIKQTHVCCIDIHIELKKYIYGTCYMFLLVLFLSIVGVFAFCKLMKLLIIHCYCLQYIVIKHTIFFVVWFKISITHFLNSSQKPFIAFYNVKQKYAFTIVSMCFQTLISNAKENTQLYCSDEIFQ